MLSRKKKNGFTLIELLVVIALMLSILGIAILSFINISNKKKQEAWEDVKAQIETAATEYFTANEYLFEGYNSTADAYISVGKLVEEDYINKITNPVTGETVDYCTKVKVEKKGNKLDATYDGNVVSSGVCGGDYQVTVSEPGAPTGVTKYYDEDGNEKTADNNTGWFNSSILTEGRSLKLCITDVKANGALKEVTIGGEPIVGDKGKYCRNYSNGKYNDVMLKLQNQKGQWTQYVSFNVDTESPSLNLNYLTNGISSENRVDHFAATYDGKGIFNSKVDSGLFAYVTGSDQYSGIYNLNMDGDEPFSSINTVNNISAFFGSLQNYDYRNSKFTITDYAGNSNEIFANFIVSQIPSCSDIKIETTGDIGDDNATFVSNIGVNFSMDNEFYFSGNAYNQTYNYYISNEAMQLKNGANLTLSGEGTYRIYGNIYNKYGVGGDYCDVWVTKDTIAPGCPSFGYVGIARNKDAADGTGACCWKSGAWRCYNTSGCEYYNGYPTSGIDDSGVAVYVNPTYDTTHWLWLTNQNGTSPRGVAPWNDWYYYWTFAGNPGEITGIYDGSLYTLFSDNYPGTSGYVNRKTLTGLQGYFASKSGNNYFSKIGFAVVYDAAGNYRECPTDYVLLRSTKTSDDLPPVPTKPRVVKKTYKTKAYHFIENDYTNCSNDGAPNIKNGSTENGGTKDIKGPWRRYTFKELDCSCESVNGVVSATATDITESTHPKGGTPKDNHAYIIYNTVTDCNKNTSSVKQVCLNGLNGNNKFHGVVWNSSSSNWNGAGWYNKSYTSKSTSNFTNKEACKWACEQAKQ